MKRPTYTLSSIVKKVFRSGERSLPREEICARLNETGLISLLDMDAEALLAKVLQMEQSPVRIGRTEAIVEVTYQPHQLFDLAYRFLRDTQSPKTLEQIVAELRRQTQFGWNQIMRMLQLERDLRFVQYQGMFAGFWPIGHWPTIRCTNFAAKMALRKYLLGRLRIFWSWKQKCRRAPFFVRSGRSVSHR